MAVAEVPQPSPRFTRPASSGDVDDDGLGLQVLIDPFLAALAAQTRLLEAAERDLVKPRDQTPSVSGWPHDAAPGCRGRRDLAGDHRGREVPGRDRGDRPDGLAQHPRALAGVRRRHPLAGDAPGLLGKPPEVRDRASSNGLPFSVVMRRARTSRRFSINDWMFSSA